MGAGRQEFGRKPHILLPLYHLANGSLIVKDLLAAWSAALEQAVVSLGVKQPVSGSVESMITLTPGTGIDFLRW